MMQVVPERFTESRSITGKTTFRLGQLLKGHLPLRPPTFADLIAREARERVGEECSWKLGLPDREWLVEEVAVSSTQLEVSGDIAAYWVARFVCLPIERETCS